MIHGIHSFSTELKTKIDVIPRGCFNIHITIIYSIYKILFSETLLFKCLNVLEKKILALLCVYDQISSAKLQWNKRVTKYQDILIKPLKC